MALLTLDDLVAFSERRAIESPLIKDRVMLTRPGCAAEMCETLRREFPGIPESYLSVIRVIDVTGIAIGRFQLSPSGSRRTSLLDQIRAVNDVLGSDVAVRMRSRGLYQVGVLDAEAITVACRESGYREGNVFSVSVSSPDREPILVADSFEQMMLLAGNLQETRDGAASKTRSDAAEEFQRRLQALGGVSPTVHSAWTELAAENSE